jgi:transcriptional regulator with XRE-family HTH domain
MTSPLGEFIRRQRELQDLSMRQLADLVGISNPYLSQIERGIRRPSAEILQQLAAALRISVETMYVHAGFLQPRHDAAPSVPEAIEADAKLTPEQKSALLGVYRSFVDTVDTVDGSR